jgi:excisionase family DNA binding protein
VASESRPTEATDTVDKPTMLSPAEVAKELGIQERTVRRWAADDVLPAEHTPTGHHRLPASLVPILQQLIKDRVPLNSRNLRVRFSQQSPLEEVRPQANSS